MLGLNQISLAVNRLLGPGDDAVLNLNFLSGSLDSRITFTRASTATRYNSSGLLETVSSNVPRFDYDPVTLAPKGLLIEEGRTNLLPQSVALDYFTTTDGITAGTGGTPSSGTGSYKRITAVAGNTAHYIQNTGVDFSATAGTSYSFSIEVQYVDHRWVGLSWYDNGFSSGCTFDLLNGAVGANKGVFTGAIKALGNGRYRLSVTGTAASTATIWVALVLLDSDKAFSTITASNLSATKVDAAFAQVEAGAFPTSYIPTTTTSASRSADIAVMTGTNFSSWYNQSEGTFVTNVIPGPTDNFYAIVGVGNDVEGIWLRNQGGSGAYNANVNDDGVMQANTFVANAFTTGNSSSAATAYKANDFASVANGGAINSDTSGTVPSPSLMYIGCVFGYGFNLSFWNGHIKQIKYYNTRKSNSELQSLTS